MEKTLRVKLVAAILTASLCMGIMGCQEGETASGTDLANTGSSTEQTAEDKTENAPVEEAANDEVKSAAAAEEAARVEEERKAAEEAAAKEEADRKAAEEAEAKAEEERKAAEAKAAAEAEEKARQEAEAAAAAEEAAQVEEQAAAAEESNRTVYITNTGKKYHNDGCRHLKKSKSPINLNDAKAQGYEPCGTCNP